MNLKLNSELAEPSSTNTRAGSDTSVSVHGSSQGAPNAPVVLDSSLVPSDHSPSYVGPGPSSGLWSQDGPLDCVQLCAGTEELLL